MIKINIKPMNLESMQIKNVITYMHLFEFKLKTKLITFAFQDRGRSPTSTNDPSRGNPLPGYGFPTQQFWVGR